MSFPQKLRGYFFWGMDLVRLLLISALAATLIGCSSASRQMRQDFEGPGRGLYQPVQERSPQMHSAHQHGWVIAAKKKNARHRNNNNLAKIPESHIVPKMDASSLVRPDDRSNIVTTPASTAKTETAPSSSQETTPSFPQLDDETVIKKAKAAIAAKMRREGSL